MQPYFLPYIGYFQLIAAVDTFVILDDVNYIKRGWVNHNCMMLQGRPHNFVIPLIGASQNLLISDIKIVSNEKWQSNLLQTIKHAYSKAPYFHQVFDLMEGIINFPDQHLNRFLLNSILQVSNYLGLKKNIIGTSSIYENSSLRGQDRIIDICKREQASLYINSIGGTFLYQKERFREFGINLRFLKTREFTYYQKHPHFIPNLSILDVIMFNSKLETQRLLDMRELI